VHYSLPKEEEQQGRCTPDKNQGSLYVKVKNNTEPLNEAALSEKLKAFGDLRSINHPPGAPPE
jgi:hypothetical protein